MREIKVFVWNVRHLNFDPVRIARIAAFIAQHEPDMFAILEVKETEVAHEFMKHFPGFSFTITEGVGSMEVLVGHKNLTTVSYELEEFQENNPNIRSGNFITFMENEEFEEIEKLKKSLDRKENGKAKLIACGDLNTMGMKDEITAEEELEKHTARLRRVQMRPLTKTFPTTWHPEENMRHVLPPSNLDHVFATEGIDFTEKLGTDAEIRLKGWPELESEEERFKWVDDYSDHAALLFKIKVGKK